jgi:uncharacterized protein YjbI with pentapeptide repeats
MLTDDIKRKIELHGKWLRDEDGGERADLSGADLSEADLSGPISRGRSLGGQSLWANLSGADLSRADLRGPISRCRSLGANSRGRSLGGHGIIICNQFLDANFERPADGYMLTRRLASICAA